VFGFDFFQPLKEPYFERAYLFHFFTIQWDLSCSGWQEVILKSSRGGDEPSTYLTAIFLRPLKSLVTGLATLYDPALEIGILG
jgi:hypothetical protein